METKDEEKDNGSIRRGDTKDSGDIQKGEAKDNGSIRRDDAKDSGDIQKDEAKDNGSIRKDDAKNNGDISEHRAVRDESAWPLRKDDTREERDDKSGENWNDTEGLVWAPRGQVRHKETNI